MPRLDSIQEMVEAKVNALKKNREEGELVLTAESNVGEIDKTEFILENQQILYNAIEELRELHLDESEIRALMLETILKNEISADAVETIANGVMNNDDIEDEELERYLHFCESTDREITADTIMVFALDALCIEETGGSIKDEVIEEAEELLEYYDEMDDFNNSEYDCDDEDYDEDCGDDWDEDVFNI